MEQFLKTTIGNGFDLGLDLVPVRSMGYGLQVWVLFAH